MPDARMTRRLAGMLATRLQEAQFDQVPAGRDHRGQRWSLETRLVTVLTAMAAGARSLAQAERVTASLSRAARRWLGIQRRVPDTTLRDALPMLQTREKDLEQKLKRLAEALTASDKPPATLVQMMAEQEQELTAVRQRMEAVKASAGVLDLEARRLENDAMKRLGALVGPPRSVASPTGFEDAFRRAGDDSFLPFNPRHDPIQALADAMLHGLRAGDLMAARAAAPALSVLVEALTDTSATGRVHSVRCPGDGRRRRGPLPK